MSNKKPKLNVASQAIEFLPDALEIEQERLPWYARVGVLMIFCIVAALLAWACIGQVDIIVKAHGRIVSDKGDIIMKPRDSAIIKSINVKKGDIVEAGQVLITFDPTLTQAEIDRLSREILIVQAEFERLTSEFNEVEYKPSNSKEEASSWQLSIYAQRCQYYKEKLNYYDSSADRLRAASKSTKQSYDKYSEILVNMSKIEDMYLGLQKKDVVAYKDVLETAMSRMEVEVEVDKFRNQLVEYEHQLLSLDAEKKAFIEEWRNGISENMVKASRELDGYVKQLEQAKSLESYVTLCAPCRAVVQDMASFPVGSAVGEAEAVITLVPLDGILEAETEVRPQDISHVQVGSTARVKLSAFPFQKHGTLVGNVRLVSANTFNRQGAVGKDNEMMTSTYYRTLVAVSGTLRNVKDDFCLLPGMEAEVEIKSGRRRIIEYLVYPLIKGLDEAFKEP